MDTPRFIKLFILNGITDEHSRLDRGLRKSFNILLLVGLSIMIPVFIGDAIESDLRGLSIITIFISFVIFLMSLVKYDKYELASFIFNLGFSIGIFLLVISYKDVEHLTISYLILIFTSMLFTTEKLPLSILIFLNVCLFFLGSYFSNFYTPINNIELDSVSKVSIYATCAISMIILSYSLITELRNSDERIGILIDSLQEQNKELTQSNEELEKLTYLASHDLKAPLRTIISFLGLAKRELESTELDSVKKYCNMASEGASQMNQLITDTMDYSLIDREKESALTQVDLNKLIDRITKFNYHADDQIVISHDELPVIKSKEVLLFKLFQNLIDNGLKYNRSTPKIIRIESNLVKDYYEISITDNGIGIAKEYHQKIFQMYKRLHGQAEYIGNGLGLAICQKICSQLKGSIRIQSEIGHGSTFIISLLA